MSSKNNLLTAIIILFLVVLPAIPVLLTSNGAPKSGSRTSSLSIYVASDLHYLSPDLTDNGDYFMRMIENSDAKAMEYSEEITEAFLSQVIKNHPDYLILTGDLTFNGEQESHIALAEKLHRVEEAGTKVLVIPGNHDLYSETAASFHGSSYELVNSITSKEFSSIYDDFGYSEALSRDKDSLSYTFELSPDLRVLFLDVNTKSYPGSLTWDTYDWIRSQLEEANKNGARVITCSHQNVLMHNALFTYDYLIGGHNELTSLYEDFGVICNLSGHMHIQHIAENPGGLTEMASSALSVSPCQFGIIDITREGLSYHTETADFPHSEEAAEFMRSKSYLTAQKRFPNGDKDLWEFFTETNDYYFAGRGDLINWNEEYYKKITEDVSISGMYLGTILEDGFKNHTELSINF